MNKTTNIKKHITDHLILHKSKSMICHIISYAKYFYQLSFITKKCNNTFCNIHRHSYSFLMKQTPINSEIPRPENRNTNVLRFVCLRIFTIILLSEIISLETAMQIKLYSTQQLWHQRWLRQRIYLPLPGNEAVSVPKEREG